MYNSYKKFPAAIETFQAALKKTIEIGKKMDIHFKLISIYLQTDDVEKVKENID